MLGIITLFLIFSARYRDLIESADSVINMKETITLLQNSVNQTEQESFHLAKYRKLLTSQTSPQTLLEDQAFQDQNQSKLLLGRKIKFLIDTPEKVLVHQLIFVDLVVNRRT